MMIVLVFLAVLASAQPFLHHAVSIESLLPAITTRHRRIGASLWSDDGGDDSLWSTRSDRSRSIACNEIRRLTRDHYSIAESNRALGVTSVRKALMGAMVTLSAVLANKQRVGAKEQETVADYLSDLSGATTSMSMKSDDVVVKRPNDERKYRALTLGNGLRVLLISEPSATRGAAALDVHVGSFCDPDDLPGLAHFCEHMLFLGTKKYPKEGEYATFLSTHGGSSNAYTDSEDTVYYFDVNAEFLKGALDRFSQFFIAPLFTKEATSRELNAIDSEHAKNINNDGFRLFQVWLAAIFICPHVKGPTYDAST